MERQHVIKLYGVVIFWACPHPIKSNPVGGISDFLIAKHEELESDEPFFPVSSDDDTQTHVVQKSEE